MTSSGGRSDPKSELPIFRSRSLFHIGIGLEDRNLPVEKIGSARIALAKCKSDPDPGRNGKKNENKMKTTNPSRVDVVSSCTQLQKQLRRVLGSKPRVTCKPFLLALACVSRENRIACYLSLLSADYVNKTTQITEKLKRKHLQIYLR